MKSAPDAQLLALYQQLYTATDPDEFAQLQEEAHARYLEVTADPRGGSSTQNLLPYPAPTDPISQGADAIRALADSIQGQVLGTLNRPGTATAMAAAYTDVAGLIFATLVCPANTLWIDWELNVQATSTAARQVDMAVAVDGVLVTDSARSVTLPASAIDNMSGRARQLVTAGTHRVAVQVRASAAGQVTYQGGSVRVTVASV